MAGILYGVGVGPGDPELLTVKAVRVIKSCDVIGIPAESETLCTAYQIALRAVPEIAEKPVLKIPIPMTREKDRLQAAYEKGCMEIRACLTEGKDVVFLNLGDPSVYGSCMPLCEGIAQMGFEVNLISGVPSFCAAAAKLLCPLAARKEQIHIFSGDVSEEEVRTCGGTRILMKQGSKMANMKEMLRELSDRDEIFACAVENATMESEKVYETIDDLPDDAGYFTTVIVKEKRKPEGTCQEKAVSQEEAYVVKNQKRLRTGITTGSCCAAAAKAAATKLLFPDSGDRLSVFLDTPKGVRIRVEAALTRKEEQLAEYMVIKDSGDDPDVTNHAQIYVSVEKANGSKIPEGVFTDERYPNLYLEGGRGVGRVTREGLEQKIGQAAINMVPRNMIFQAVNEVAEFADFHGDLLIMIHVPEGEKLAAKTFNPNLGICGGISILGTSGILEPMSEKAIIDTIETEIRQRRRQGKDWLLVAPGNYGQAYASDYLGLNLKDSVKCGNYIGDTVDLAVAYGMKSFLLVGNLGKLVKLAAGIMNTHSKTADARGEILACHAVLCGGDTLLAKKITASVNTEEMLDLLSGQGLAEAVIKSLCDRIDFHLARRAGEKMRIGAIVFSEKQGYLGETKNAGELLRQIRLRQAEEQRKE